MNNIEFQKQICKDPRFSKSFKNPRFRSSQGFTKKSRGDNRFHSLFKNTDYFSDATGKEHGGKAISSISCDTQNCYEEENFNSDDNPGICKLDVKDSFGNNLLDNTSFKICCKTKQKLEDCNFDFARGTACLFSDGSSSDESSINEKDDEMFEDSWNNLDKGSLTTETSTYRLALCNLDWDRLGALDIMVLCSSFIPNGNLIKQVSVSFLLSALHSVL